MMEEVLTFLFIEDEEIRAEPYSVILAIIFLLIGMLVSIILCLNIRKNLSQLEEIKDVVVPVYNIILLNIVRYIVSLIDFIVWYITDGDYSLNGFYESMLWFFVFRQFYIIVSHQNLIQFSRSRITRYNTMILVLRWFLVFGAVLIFVINFVFNSVILETLYLIIAFIISLGIVRIIKTEINNMESIINKIRLGFLYSLWYYFLIYFLAIIIGYGLMEVLFPDGNIDGVYFSIVAFFLNLSPIMIVLSAYWSVFIPDRSRRKHRIINPKDFIE
ncbi:MAG: hypothetical protein ACXAC2_01960 [Candidatus Kariarchaeaceae archaeon]|jgi:hypothetical protein